MTAGRTLHRIRVPRGTVLGIKVGAELKPDRVIGRWARPGVAVRIPAAEVLRRPPHEIGSLLAVPPGSRVDAGAVLARAPDGREVHAPEAGLLLAASVTDGGLLFARLGEEEPVIGHVKGRVRAIDDDGVVVEVPGTRLQGVGGIGDTVHGELLVVVDAPDEELRAASIDANAAGKILVGGSRASAEALTRARAMGVVGVVLGGVLDKELRDFEAIQRRRQEAGGLTSSFGLLLTEGFGKVAIDPLLLSWFRAHTGRLATLSGSDHLLYVYDAAPPPERRVPARVGDRVIASRRPFQGRAGALVAILDDLHAAPSGVAVRMGLVRLEDGRLVPIPLANLEATLAPDAG